MIRQTIFGQLPDGRTVSEYQLSNADGMTVSVLDWGATIRRWITPTGPQSDSTDIVLGFDSLAEYIAEQNYIGATVGRYANRIANGRFNIDGQPYKASVNLGEHCLHGGHEGFNQRLWLASVIEDSSPAVLRLGLTSADGDQGFPGNLTVELDVSLDDSGTLRLVFRAQTDQDTLFNPTQHSYFNLNGHDGDLVLNHEVQVLADEYTPADETGIPTGEQRSVTGSAFDLQQPQQLARHFEHHWQTLKTTNGLDHNWCLAENRELPRELLCAAHAQSADGALKLSVRTNMPGMQVYTGNFLGADVRGKDGARYRPHQGICFETQFYPDAPNKPEFPSPVLRAGETCEYVTEYQLTRLCTQ